MKKHLSILLSVVIIFCSVISPLIYSSAENSDTDYLNDASNWATYNSSNVKNGWWGAPVAMEHNGKSAIKVNSMNILATATKLVVDENTDYSISFEYCGSLLNPKALKTVGISTVTSGEIVYDTEGDIYNSGEVGDSTDWTAVSFEFNSGANTELEFFILPAARDTEYAENPLYLANFKIEKLNRTTSSEDLNNASNWATYNSSNVKNGWWGAPVAMEHNGKSAIKVNSMNILATATKLVVDENTDYSISFEYCGSLLNPKALKTVGISTVTSGEIVYDTEGDIYNSGEVGDSTDWTAVSFEFNSGANTELEFFILPAASNTNYEENPLYLANFKIEKSEDIILPPAPEITPDNYFETADNWGVSISNSGTRPCQNILVEGISDTTVATGKEVITWASFTNDKTVTSNASGSSLLINNPYQTAHIKLPDIQIGKSYRLKFAYKPTSGQANSSVLRFVGIFDPEFTQRKITENSSLTYADLKTGFIAVDAYTTLIPGRYRFKNGVYEDNCAYGRLNNNTYNESNWLYEEIYFTANAGLDNLYLLISYTAEAGKLYVDGFECETVDSIPENQMPGYLLPSDAPTLDENGYRLIDMEKENIVTGDADYIQRLSNGGYGDNGATLYIPAFDYSTTSNPTKVTCLNYAAIHTNKNDPYFRTAVDSNTDYNVTVRIKRTTDVETDASLLIYADWYGCYTYKNNTGTVKGIKYDDLPLGEWTEYSFKFKTVQNQNEIAFSFITGSKYPELYIDEVEITEIPPLYPGPQDKTILDFECDSSYYDHIKSDFINFEKVVGPNGKKTTAMHISERPLTENENVTFTSFDTVLNMKDQYLTFPVEENTIYTFSLMMKVGKSKIAYNDAKIKIFADFRGRGVAGNGIFKDYLYSDILGTDWTEYKIKFTTLPGQTTATFAINAFYYHPDIWIDDITYTKQPAGYMGSTDLSYCEYQYNLAKPTKGTVTGKKVVKFDFADNTQYTFGLDLSGSGKVTIAFDEAGNNIIKTYNVTKAKKRLGVDLITDSHNNDVYLIFEPTGAGITYKDLCVFAKYSIAGVEIKMGYSDNVNTRKPVKYTNIPTVVGDEWEAVLPSNSTSVTPSDNTDTADSNAETVSDDGYESPSTGDNTAAVCLVAVTGLISALAVLLFKRNNNLTEVNK